MERAEPITAVLLLNFGEPPAPELGEVTQFLERIFLANARLEPGDDAAALARSRELARRRAPGLIEAYERIGGSPLNRQAAAQAAAVQRTLRERGHPMRVEVGMQYTAPLIDAALASLRAAGAERIVALPAYPLCGPSTTVAALDEVDRALGQMGWQPDVRRVTGWHRHPGYLRLRAGAVRQAAAEAGWSLTDPSVRLVFSAHGTPLRYIEEGSRYVRYVEDWCRSFASALGVPRWTLGYQNHANRGIEWTQPDIETALEGLAAAGATREDPAAAGSTREDSAATGSTRDPATADATREGPAAADSTQAPFARPAKVLVDAVSFMHEQSETLMELDVELADHARSLGLEFRRVRIPHDEAAFADVLADLALAAAGVAAPSAAAAPPGVNVSPAVTPPPAPAVSPAPVASSPAPVASRGTPSLPALTPCVCRPGADVCFNGTIPHLPSQAQSASGQETAGG